MIFPLAWAVAFGTGGAPLGLVAAPVIVAAILLSTARGAWLAMLAVAGGLALCTRGARVVGGVAALATAACLTIALTPQLRAEAADMFARGGANAGRSGSTRRTSTSSTTTRSSASASVATRSRGPYYDAHPDADRRSHAHNNFLQIAAEAGLVGLAAFGLLYATVLRRGWEAIRTRRARRPGTRRPARGRACSASSSAASRSTRSATPRSRSRCGPRSPC
jgi:O-antigen ligase